MSIIDYLALSSLCLTFAALLYGLFRMLRSDISDYQMIQRRIYAPGEVIFYEGDKPDGVYSIRYGTVKITEERNHREFLLANLGSGTVFGEMALIDGKPRSATATALSEVECFIMGVRVFKKMMKRLRPEIRDLIEDMVAQLRNKNHANMKEKEDTKELVAAWVDMDAYSDIEDPFMREMLRFLISKLQE